VHPDISVHAKLLTGGLVPLCTTVSSESIYESFLGTEKRDALLHGHSYTAHPVGCHVANTSLETMLQMDRCGVWKVFKDDWANTSSTSASVKNCDMEFQGVWSSWSKDFVTRISTCREVESTIALGSVLAISLQDENAGKYCQV
jgi:dethiobiotin synthetase/adenosylmethionine--8-amino-7-oxononanoate aminotransferase